MLEALNPMLRQKPSLAPAQGQPHAIKSLCSCEEQQVPG